jgi:DNA repair protein RecO (recombination protein O)
VSVRVYKAEAVVLRRHNLGETDKSVILFTRNQGKLSAVAKGARRPTSRISGATELFSHCVVMLAVGRNLDVITQCEVREPFLGLRADLNRFAAASYLAELTDSMLEDRMPAPGLFDLLVESLRILDAGGSVLAAVCAFELHASRELGYEPSVSLCVRCRNAVLPSEEESAETNGEHLSQQTSSAGTAVGFSPSLGGVVCRSCLPRVRDAEKIDERTVMLARQMLNRSPAECQKIQADDEALRTLGRLMRRHIECRTERRVKAADFMEALAASAEKL